MKLLNADRKKIVILGSTGSIGQQALTVIENYPQYFQVIGLAAHTDLPLLKTQVNKFKPRITVWGDVSSSLDFAAAVAVKGKVLALTGLEGLCEAAAMAEADIVLVALSGAVGILPTLAAMEAGKAVALANKETLVAAGEIIMSKAVEKNTALVPVDSEHSAIFQCLAGEARHLRNIWITASGGPFRECSYEELHTVTVEMALKHPNWSMGPKITIDSATLMNKGLEVIEAHHLFQVGYEQIKVVVHKESIIHSLVELTDGAFLAHMGWPDMRIPIQYAFTYPERLPVHKEPLDLTALGALHFSPPDYDKFPCLRLAYEAGRLGGTMPAVLNAANEAAVNAFLAGKIKYLDIPVLTEKVMMVHEHHSKPDLNAILGFDAWARTYCAELMAKGVYK